MKIGVIGIRGIPVIYSGFESFAEELSVRLVSNNHECVIYCREGYVESDAKMYKGVELVILPSMRGKNFETISHSFISMIHAVWRRDVDVLYFLGVGSAVFCLLPRLFGIKTVINVDGLDWKREKWGFMARVYLSISERIATTFSNQVVTDSKYIQSYYREKFNYSAPYIPYGYFEGVDNPGDGVLKKFNLHKKSYVVWVGRMVPDNHLDELVDAYKKIKSSFKCVIVGGDFNESEYEIKMRKLAKNDSRFVFTGFLKRKDYESIVKNAYAYIETKRSGGTHPSLVEAMGFGSLILAYAHEANKEVLGNSAFYYLSGSGKKGIKFQLEKVIALPSVEVAGIKKKALSRAIKHYSWKSVVSKYEKLFLNLRGG